VKGDSGQGMKQYHINVCTAKLTHNISADVISLKSLSAQKICCPTCVTPTSRTTFALLNQVITTLNLV
jgi:hypothetical protein